MSMIDTGAKMIAAEKAMMLGFVRTAGAGSGNGCLFDLSLIVLPCLRLERRSNQADPCRSTLPRTR
ncbi:MAG: hypothetical protein AAGA73_05430, partial [Pseudomonadota bacterium]